MDKNLLNIPKPIGVVMDEESGQNSTNKKEIVSSTKPAESKNVYRAPYAANSDFKTPWPSNCHSCCRHNHNNNPIAYVNVWGSNQVAVIDIRRGVQITSIGVGNHPTGIDISPDQRYVYVTNTGDATLSVIRTGDNKVINTINLQNFPFESYSPVGVKVSLNGRYVYVANGGTNNISIVDTTLMQVINDIPLPADSHPLIIGIDSRRNLAYVTLLNTGKVAVIDLNINLLVKLIDLGYTSVIGIAIASNKPLAVVSRQNDSSLSFINTDLAEASPDLIGVANSPVDVMFSPAANRAYVACKGEETISVVDTFLHAEINNVFTDNAPSWLGQTLNGRFLVAADVTGGTVSIIETNGFTITAKLYLGPMLELIAVKG